MNLKEAREHLNKGQGGLNYTQLPGCKFVGVMSKLGKGIDAKTLTARVIVAASEGAYKQGVAIISTIAGQVTGRLQDYGWTNVASKRNPTSGNTVTVWVLSV